jgi:hypothetical protein
VEGLAEEDKVTEEFTLVTVCVTTGEVLPLSLASPPYTAVIECEPPVSVEVLYVAFPTLSATVPRAVFPSMKVTDPVAASGSPPAVKVTDDPYVDGLADEASVTLVFCSLTVCVNADDVLPLSFVSPP